MQRYRLEPESVLFARLDEDICVVRIDGRGSHVNSPDLQKVAEQLFEDNPRMRLVIDLDHCPTMDSTFMGTLAGLTKRQCAGGHGNVTIVNAGEQNRRLLEILGLIHVLDFRAGDREELDDTDFEAGASPEMSKLDRTVHMIQAHEELVRLDDQNMVKFEGVLQFLNDSLRRQQNAKDQ